MIRTLPLYILLGVALASPLAAAEHGALPPRAVVVDEARLEALPRTAEARRLAKSADAAIVARDAARLQAVLARASSQDPVLYEWLLATVVQRLRVASPMPALEGMLSTLSATPARVYRRHPETAAEYYVPVFEPDRMAAGTLATWTSENQARAWIERFETEPLAAVAAARAPDGAAGLVRAIALAEDKQLARLAASLPPDGFTATPGFWSALALRTRDPAHFALAFRHEGEADALALMQRMAGSLSQHEATTQLEALLHDPTFASAALSTLASISTDNAALAPRLLALMADEKLGPTAATVLARRVGAKEIHTALAQLGKARGATEQRNLLLYLRLVGTSAALASAKSAAGLPNLDPALRAELASW